VDLELQPEATVIGQGRKMMMALPVDTSMGGSREWTPAEFSGDVVCRAGLVRLYQQIDVSHRPV
jgi:hypothetical protein